MRTCQKFPGAVFLASVSLIGILTGEAKAQTAAAESHESTAEAGEIVVTARLQAESAMTIPESITAFNEEALTKLGIQSFNDYATKIPNLSFSYGSGAFGFVDSKTMAIRGISGIGTTSYYIDDTPIPEGLDPQVVDIQRIEILKGPRGTLFGQGSLGGNVRMITNRPSLSDNEMRVSSEIGFTKNGGSLDYLVNGVGNLVLQPDKLGLRLVAFTNHRAGFYDRVYPGKPGSAIIGGTLRDGNQGSSTTYGGSLALRWAAADNLTLNLRVMGQDQRMLGYPALDAPLPRFKPTKLEQEFQSDNQDSVHDAWFLPSLEISYETDSVTFTSSTSYFSRNAYLVEEGTEQTNSFLGIIESASGLPAGAIPRYDANNSFKYDQDSHNRAFNQEIRASFTASDWLSGVVGARYGKSTFKRTLIGSPLFGLSETGLWPDDTYWIGYEDTQASDKSIYGEAYLRYGDFELSLGLRQYWLTQQTNRVQTEGLLSGGLVLQPRSKNSAQGLNPKVALSYKLPNDGLVYASASKGFRQGLINFPLSQLCVDHLPDIGLTEESARASDPDTVWNYELGAKVRVGKLNVTAAAFQMDWKGIQQTVIVPVCGYSLITNAGAARSRGAELEIAGELFRGFSVRMGIGYNDAKIIDAGASQREVGSTPYNVPKFTASAAGNYEWSFSDTWGGFIGGDYSFVDKSVSAIARGNPVRPSYSIVNARAGVRRGNLEIGIYARNLFDERANLGDLNNLSLPKVDASGGVIPRVVVLQPRQIGLSFKYGF